MPIHREPDAAPSTHRYCPVMTDTPAPWLFRGNNGAAVTYGLAAGLLIVVLGVTFFGPTPAARTLAAFLCIPAVLLSGAVVLTTTRELRRRRSADD